MTLIDFLVSLHISVLGSILGTLICRCWRGGNQPQCGTGMMASHQRIEKPLRVITPVGAFPLVDE